MEKAKELIVYAVGSEVLIKGSGHMAVIERIVIGDNYCVSYQVIDYVPERHQIQVSQFEITPITTKAKKMPIGFNTSADNSNDNTEVKKLTVLVDEKHNLIGVDNEHKDVIVQIAELSEEEIKTFDAVGGGCPPI